jgi:hypothetical protein
LLHRVAVELASLGMLAEISGLAVVPDERALRIARVVGRELAALGATEGRVGRAGLGKVGQCRVVGLDELGGAKVCEDKRASKIIVGGAHGETYIRLAATVLPCDRVGSRRA